MLQMIQYQTGERRVVDAEHMIASEWLHHTETDAPLADYDLRCELSQDDLDVPHVVLREE